MRPVLKRIAVNGLLSALLLGLIGLGFTELAGIWLTTQSTERRAAPAPVPLDGDDPTTSLLRYRVPLTMAGWGVAFVVVGELGLYLWRGRRPVDGSAAAKGLKPDTAEVLLEELLQQLESGQTPPPAEAKPVLAVPPPSPSLPITENSPSQPNDQPA